MAIVGRPSPTMPFTRPAKRKMPETMMSSLMVPYSTRAATKVPFG